MSVSDLTMSTNVLSHISLFGVLDRRKSKITMIVLFLDRLVVFCCCNTYINAYDSPPKTQFKRDLLLLYQNVKILLEFKLVYFVDHLMIRTDKKNTHSRIFASRANSNYVCSTVPGLHVAVASFKLYQLNI